MVEALPHVHRRILIVLNRSATVMVGFCGISHGT
jgi:hypothetical protein